MAKKGRQPKIVNLFNPKPSKTSFSDGNKSAGILDDFAVRKAVDSQEGTITKVPVNNYDIANKAYVDAAVAPIVSDTNFWLSGGGILQPITSSHQLSASNLIIDGTISGGVITGTNVTSGADPGHTHTAYAAALGADDNYVTDAEKIVIGNTSGSNTGDQDISGIAANTADISYLSGTVVAGDIADMTYLSGTVVADIATDVAANTVSCATIANISAATLTNATNITGNDTDITYLSGTVVAGVVTDVTANTLSCGTIADISAATLVNTTHSAGDGSDHADVAANTLSCATIANISAATLLNTTHRNDNTQAHSDYLLNNSDDTMVGVLTLSGGIVAEDNTVISTGIIRNIILGTDETPPTASGFVTGTLYVQYTA